MYFWVLLFLCILNFSSLKAEQQGYEPEFVIIQPPAPQPPAGYDANAVIKDEPIASGVKSKTVEDPEPSPPPSTTAPPKSESAHAEAAAEAQTAEEPEPPPPTPAKKSEAPAKKPEPSSPPPPSTSEEKPEPPPRKSHPKDISQKTETKKEESKVTEAPPKPQEDEPKAPPQHFKYDDCISDTIFVIDSTSSVRNLFEQHRIYAQNVIKEMDISAEANHIGVVLYSSKQRLSIKISLSDPQKKENISAKISSLPYLSGITATGAALSLAIKDLEHRRRNTITNIVVISDGFSYDLVDEPVKQLKQMPNVRIFAVSLGEAYRKFEMLMIASHEENFLTGADSYKELVQRMKQCNEGLRNGDKNGGGVQEVTESSSTQGQTKETSVASVAPTTTITTTTKAPKKSDINEEKSDEKKKNAKSSESSQSSESSEEVVKTTKKPKPAEPKKETKSSGEKQPKNNNKKDDEGKKEKSSEKPQVPKTNGNNDNDKKDVVKNKECKYDIVFVIDASGSLRNRYQHQLEIATKLIDKFDFEKTQFGVIRYSGRRRSKVAIELGSKTTKESFTHEFLKMPFMGGTTFTDEALDKAYTEITGPKVRSDALPMVIVFTDGFSQPDPAESAKKIHAKNIPTFAIGITDGQIVNEVELKSIASTPKNVFLDSNINELEQLFVQLSENC